MAFTQRAVRADKSAIMLRTSFAFLCTAIGWRKHKFEGIWLHKAVSIDAIRKLQRHRVFVDKFISLPWKDNSAISVLLTVTKYPFHLVFSASRATQCQCALVRAPDLQPSKWFATDNAPIKLLLSANLRGQAARATRGRKEVRLVP